TSVQARQYDQFGNLTILDGIGDPNDPWDDRRVTTRFMPPNTSKYLISLPFDVETTDAAGARVADTQIFYDGSTSHTLIPTFGNPTRTDQWDSVIGTLRTERGFDSFGNLTQVIDADGRKTTTVWDPVFARFPVKECNSRWCVTSEWDAVQGTK